MRKAASLHLARLLALGGTALLLAACSEPKSAPQPEARPVRTTVVEFVDGRDSLTLPGTIEARQVAQLGFRTAGKIMTRMVDVGAEIRPGQELARLDEADLRLQVRTMSAQLAATAAELDKARVDFERVDRLQGSPAFNKSVFDQRQASLKLAEARRDQMRTQLRLNENQLNYSSLKSDVRGVVMWVHAEAGQVISAGQPVFTVARTDELEVLVNIPERKLADVQGAGEIRFQLWSDPSKSYRARLRELAPAADAATRTFAARFAFVDAPSAPQIGMSATLTISRAEARDIVELPLTALFQSGDRPAVWVVDPSSGGLSLRTVEVASYGEKVVRVSGGLARGEHVVTAGVHKLDTTMRVRVLEMAARS